MAAAKKPAVKRAAKQPVDTDTSSGVTPAPLDWWLGTPAPSSKQPTPSSEGDPS